VEPDRTLLGRHRHRHRRDSLGFAGDRAPELAPSKKQQRQRLDDLKTAGQNRIRQSIYPALVDRFGALLPPDAQWKLEQDTVDPDGQTLLFYYRAVVGTASYIKPVVRIEMGARSDTEPVHEETYRPADKSRKARLARHYYDLWCLIRKGVAAHAVAEPGLFDRVAAHRVIYFRWSWVDYSTIARGSRRLLPRDDQMSAWRQDYGTMQSEMFFGDVPTFDEILQVVGKFERDFNRSTSQP
jgi:hypothetical protein